MILLPRTRNAQLLRGFSGAGLQNKLAKLLGYYYEGNGTVDFKPKARQIWGASKKVLKDEAGNKCAYCEADTAVVAHGDVEHFRPKSEYWWLAYCYDNYTFSCQICNQTYKGDRFPIAGKKLVPPRLPKKAPSVVAKLKVLAARLSPDPARATSVGIQRQLAAERPDLPHPYLEDPETLFAWEENRDAAEVRLVARGSGERARRAVRAAEEVLGLNRTELLRLRWLAFETMEVMAITVQEGTLKPETERRVVNQLRAMAADGHPFAAMKRFYLKKWGVL